MRALVISAVLLPSALALVGQAAACDETIILEYQVSDGRYQFELNDVYLESGGAQFASGGLPITDWMLSGENLIKVSMNAENGDFSVYAICDDGSGRRDFDRATIEGQERVGLTFNVDAPPERLYLAAEPTDDEGLLEAVEALKSAFSARDFDAVWDLHVAMRAEMEAAGQPMKAAAYEMGKIVENIDPEIAPGLTTRPVLGGRVWEVHGAQFAVPISDVVSVNGGQIEFKTGSFWMKIDGAWSVYRK